MRELSKNEIDVVSGGSQADFIAKEKANRKALLKEHKNLLGAGFAAVLKVLRDKEQDRVR